MKYIIAAILILIAAAAVYLGTARPGMPLAGVSDGWTVTSYYNVNEELYEGQKVEVFNSEGESLGFYRQDFLEQVRIDGSGLGDGVQNSGGFLHYDYQINDGKTHYLTDRPLGAYSNELTDWTGERPSVAVNPPLPQGTVIVFEDLGQSESPEWVVDLLKSKAFYADDTFFLPHSQEKKIDVYVGLQETREMGSPQNLLMRNATVSITYPLFS